MTKTALITGSTDGIGKATAIELAKKGYSIHILGTNTTKGENVLQTLNALNTNAKHELFITDLSKMAAVNLFLDNYLKTYTTLDVLILNAGIFPKTAELSEDGIDKSFSVGYISRYLFSVRLNKLLNASSLGKVVHVCGGVLGKINYAQLSDPKYSRIKGVWQNSIGSALLVNFWKDLTASTVSHMHWLPGMVSTETAKKNSGLLFRILAKLIGMKPEVAGKMLADHVDTVSKPDMEGKFFINGKLKKTSKRILDGQDELAELIKFSESFTQIKVN